MSYRCTPRYKTSNWRAYNHGLKQRGSLMVWFDADMEWLAKPSGKGGRQQVYSDAAIQACRTLKVLFGLPLRQIEPGFAIGSRNLGEGDLWKAFWLYQVSRGQCPTSAL